MGEHRFSSSKYLISIKFGASPAQKSVFLPILTSNSLALVNRTCGMRFSKYIISAVNRSFHL